MVAYDLVPRCPYCHDVLVYVDCHHCNETGHIWLISPLTGLIYQEKCSFCDGRGMMLMCDNDRCPGELSLN